jgi:hypothetical protein
MTTATVRLPRMAKKKRASDKGSKAPVTPHKEPVLGLRFPSSIIDLMRELASANRRTLTTQITIALEEHLAKHGKWPPAPAPPSPSDTTPSE